MATLDKQKLIRAALRARGFALAPYSKFKVGAALLTKSGEIIGGANVENASYGLTCCAERVALFKALTEGKRNFVAVAVVARCPGGAMPAARAGNCWPSMPRGRRCSWPTAGRHASSGSFPCANYSPARLS